MGYVVLGAAGEAERANGGGGPGDGGEFSVVGCFWRVVPTRNGAYKEGYGGGRVESELCENIR